MLENKNMIDLVGSLKEMSSEQLSRLIQEETTKEDPSDELVLTVLDILEAREKENPIELGPKGKAAWKKYQSKVRSRNRKTVLIWKPLMQVASVLLVITLLFALLPTQANAETWWERLARWTEELFSFVNNDTTHIYVDDYVFQSEHDGLLQFYKTVTEVGIEVPVVPMWIPDNYLLVNIIKDTMGDQHMVMASFSDGGSEIIFILTYADCIVPYQYHKDATELETYERNGITHNIITNNDQKTVVWIRDNLECAFTIDCQEEILYQIIDSIYSRR